METLTIAIQKIRMKSTHSEEFQIKTPYCCGLKFSERIRFKEEIARDNLQRLNLRQDHHNTDINDWASAAKIQFQATEMKERREQ